MKKFRIITAILLVVVLAFSIAACTAKNNTQEKYILYIGLPEGTDLAAAKETVNDICLENITGFTVFNAEGGFTEADGQFVPEETLVYYFLFAQKETIVDIANEVLSTIEGTSILFETEYSNAVHSSSENFPK